MVINCFQKLVTDLLWSPTKELFAPKPRYVANHPVAGAEQKDAEESLVVRLAMSCFESENSIRHYDLVLVLRKT
jgi:hypothetical protein